MERLSALDLLDLGIDVLAMSDAELGEARQKLQELRDESKVDLRAVVAEMERRIKAPRDVVLPVKRKVVEAAAPAIKVASKTGGK